RAQRNAERVKAMEAQVSERVRQLRERQAAEEAARAAGLARAEAPSAKGRRQVRSATTRLSLTPRRSRARRAGQTWHAVLLCHTRSPLRLELALPLDQLCALGRATAPQLPPAAGVARVDGVTGHPRGVRAVARGRCGACRALRT